MDDKEKLYWYHFVFLSGNTTYTTYTGYPEQVINLTRIEYSRQGSEAPKGAIMVNCTMLGYTSREDFKGV